MWLPPQAALALAALAAVVGLGLRSARGRLALVGAMCREAGLVLVLYALWRVLGSLRHTRTADGLANGRVVWDAERALHIANEASIEAWFLQHPALIQAANVFYAVVHVPALIVFLVWLFVRHRDRYPALRNTVAIVTGVSLVMHFVAVAPPRLYPELGFVDAARLYGQSVYGQLGQGVSDQMSAMPSLHVAWAVIVAVGVIAVAASPWRWLVVLHPVLTVVVVVATANHWWLDGVVAVAIIAVVMAAQRATAGAVAALRLRVVAEAPAVTPAEALAPEASGRA